MLYQPIVGADVSLHNSMEIVDLRVVQRAAAEVGPVLHRLKSVARQRAVVLMAQNLEGVEDDSAWMVVFACTVRMLRSPSRPF
jgi:hypothetical protein